MISLTLYYNAACSKCRQTLKILEGSGRPFTAVEYLKTPPSPELIHDLLKQLGVEPLALVRVDEDEYEELGLAKNPPETRKQWCELLSKHPILIQRPIVSDGKRAVIGRPPEKVTEFLNSI